MMWAFWSESTRSTLTSVPARSDTSRLPLWTSFRSRAHSPRGEARSANEEPKLGGQGEGITR